MSRQAVLQSNDTYVVDKLKFPDHCMCMTCVDKQICQDTITEVGTYADSSPICQSMIDA